MEVVVVRYERRLEQTGKGRVLNVVRLPEIRDVGLDLGAALAQSARVLVGVRQGCPLSGDGQHRFHTIRISRSQVPCACGQDLA